MKGIFRNSLYSIVLSLLATTSAFAQVKLPDDIRPETLRTVVGDTAEEQAASIVGQIVLTAIQFAGAIAILMIVLSGLRYVLSRGDDNEVQTAKAGVTWSVAALVILILAYSIVSTVFNLAASFGS